MSIAALRMMPRYADAIAEAGIKHYGTFPDVNLFHVPDGWVVLKWACDDEKMEIRVRTDGKINWYCSCFGDGSGNEGWSTFDVNSQFGNPWPPQRKRVRR